MCRMDNEFESNALPAQLLLNMRAIYGQLKRAERSAADLILTDPAHLAEMTIAEAAQTLRRVAAYVCAHCAAAGV